MIGTVNMVPGKRFTPEEKRGDKSIIKKCKRKAAEEILKKRGYITVYEN